MGLALESGFQDSLPPPLHAPQDEAPPLLVVSGALQPIPGIRDQAKRPATLKELISLTGALDRPFRPLGQECLQPLRRPLDLVTVLLPLHPGCGAEEVIRGRIDLPGPYQPVELALQL